MEKTGVFAIVLIALVVVVFAFFLLQEQKEPALYIGVSDNNQRESVIVKQSGGAALLAAECTDEDYISETANYIVEGIVDSSESRWNEDEETGRHIITYVNFSIEKYVKGSPFGDKLQIETVGGCVGEICEFVEDQPGFEQGKNLRIYFYKTGNEFWFVCGQMGVEEIVEEDTTIEIPVVKAQPVKEFAITAKRWTFTPNTITVNEGDLVKLTITSIDVTHGFSLSAFGVNERLSSGNTVSVEFTADKKGTFSFFCNVSCGTGHSGMRGTLIVE